MAQVFSRESLARLQEVALEDFPEPVHRKQITDYVRELSHLMNLQDASHSVKREAEDPNPDTEPPNPDAEGSDPDTERSSRDAKRAKQEAERAKATCEATGDDEVTLLYKLEDYLESILVERMVKGGMR